MRKLMGKEYLTLLNEIKSRIAAARIQASRSVNNGLIQLYWDIGRSIIERQEKYKWGDAVVEKLANDLKEDFKSTFGFSVQNLWYMRQFYLEYKDDAILQQLVGELPWGHNILIFSQIKDKKERMYYLKASAQMGWSRNVLLNQIKAGAYQYQKKIPKQHNFPKALPGHLAEQADESLKSVYNLDFLDITKPVLERELERRLVEKVKRFMLELGKGFSFIGNQYRLTLKDNEYFVDLLFYNRILKSLVAVELKTGKFEIEYAAKMDFYLDLLNEQVKLKDENSSIGIILCVKKDIVVVEYAMRHVVNPMGVAEYRLTAHPPKELKALLPSEQEMKTQLQNEIKSKK
ncbi:MAG: PDDEXK nuclease domain-containing protein [Candidatus Omnitrophota bacterium]|nr:PDDEXK nuclease domain-containing protein [Candidatus Omnitrophota bacterium]